MMMVMKEAMETSYDVAFPIGSFFFGFPFLFLFFFFSFFHFLPGSREVWASGFGEFSFLSSVNVIDFFLVFFEGGGSCFRISVVGYVL